MRFKKLIDFKKALPVFLIAATLAFLCVPLAEVKADDVPMWDPVVTTSTALLEASGNPLTSSVATAQEKIVELTWSEMIGPMIKAAMVSMIVNVAQYALDTMAYQSAVWVASGGEGQSSLFNGAPADEAWKNFGNDIIGEAFGSLSKGLQDYLDIDFNLCAPGDPALRLGLQLGLKSFYQPPKPSCDWQSISDNWEGFSQTIQETSANPTESMLNALAKGLKPGQNTLSYFVTTNIRIHETALQKKDSLFSEFLANSGFSGVKDIVTGYSETPASLVKDQLTSDLDKAKHGKQDMSFLAAMTNSDLLVSIGTHTASVFVNTLLSQLVQNIYNGLLPVNTMDVDVFDDQSADTSGRERAEDTYAGMVSTTPTRLDDYNVLTEFVSCPDTAVTRQINNCVTDSTLMQAISRSLSNNPMTVAEAIEQGYLNGGWALYPSTDLAHNQDVYCYTYGYCYGNLVKLRKARIISVGWEMAANSENNPDSSPITLQEVVDGFNDCNSENKIDASHPWCHLIDPNWVLKYPTQRCDASMIGDLTFSSSSSASRSATCVDAPSCVAEGEDGSCEGYGYCVREKNTWNFSGDECPAEYASCMSFTNTDTSQKSSWLFNTVDQSVCSAENAGCTWYRINKYLDQKSTATVTTDDTYEWLPGDEVYISADRADDVMSFTSGAVSPRTPYTYSSDGATEDGSYNLYAFEDRIYFDSEVETCSEESVGCSEVYPVGANTALNVLRNPSFEDATVSSTAADFWTASGATYDTSGSHSSDSNRSIYLATSSDSISQTNIPLQQGTFYTVSLYANGGAATLSLDFSTSNNTVVDLTGYSTDCDSTSGDIDTLRKTTTASSDFESFDCTFTTPILSDSRLYIVADLTIGSAAATYIDAIQLEASATPSSFRDGYGGSTLTTDYLQIPPAWLGCTGEETDSADCDNYAKVCAATEAGCSLYTPVDGDPDVPAIISDEDQCPSECAGYATYRQEDAPTDAGEFPLYFIADSADTCTSEYVGCDEFTNLETEGIETYSDLRACVTPEMDAGSVYFTWEGSDMAGYQLVSYQLLASNLTDAPCVDWTVISAGELQCTEDSSTVTETEACDEHSDILTNPDCREFYDTEGYIHYRLYSETVSVSEDCTAYRISNLDPTDGDSDGIADDCEYSGGFQTAAGECRYFIEPNESTSCPTTMAGCREYTGGSSRNASVIFSDNFEAGSYGNWETVDSSLSLAISNESVAVDGHSLRVVAGSDGDAFQVQHDFVDGAVCEDEGGCESTEGCTIDFGESSCGPLVGQMVAGKTFVVSFWAKGTGTLAVSMVEDGGGGDPRSFGEAVQLTNSWQLYELGPLDTSGSDFSTFNENAVLTFSASAQTYYIDNIQLEQTEENLTLIKDSWVTPSACDETPAGALSEQYYLGCEEYTDQDDATYYIYQFGHICSESAVGCSAFYTTQNSASPYSQVYNLTCSVSPAVTTPSAACPMNGEEVCTVLYGQTSCQFDYEGNLPTPLPDNISLGAEAVYTPADQVRYLIDDGDHSCTVENMGCTEVGLPTFTQDRTAVTGFTSAYLLNQPDNYSSTLCSNNELFCAEWASTEDGNYYFKNPGDQSCEYKNGTSINGTSYSGWFREGTSEFCYGTGNCSGDNRTCTSDAVCIAAGAGECVINTGSYLANGDYSGIWRNGDTSYGGWAGICDQQYDLCSEFSDPLDTREGEDLDGASYYYIDNEKIGDEGTTSANRCNGQASLQEGCVLFNDATDASSVYASSPSFLVSEHADVFFGETPRSLQTPVSCDNPTDGAFTLTNNTTFNVCENRCAYNVAPGNIIDNLAVITGPSTATTATFYGGACYTDTDCQIGTDGYGVEVEGTCANLAEDPAADLSAYYFTNDSNRVVKVYRDRVCAEWLACSDSQAAWDERINSWTDVCSAVDLCNQYDTSTSEGGVCSNLITEDPVVLDADKYSSRDVSWYGLEYSGYAIPNQLPTEFYDQVNISASGYCTNGSGGIEINSVTGEPIIVTCSDASDCGGNGAAVNTCTLTEDLSYADQSTYNIFANDYHLAYTASSCDGANGTSCTAGFCDDSGLPCAESSQCTTGECITGYCTAQTHVDCSQNSDCDYYNTHYGSSGDFTCQGGSCVGSLTNTDGSSMACFSAASDCPTIVTGDLGEAGALGTECTPGVLAKAGTCYNNSCLVGLDGQPFPLNSDDAEGKTCRGYPETNSPFPASVVTNWINPDNLSDGADESDLLSSSEITAGVHKDILPYDYISGFNDATTCAPTKLPYTVCVGGTNDGERCSGPGTCDSRTCGDAYQIADDCLCSYDKVEYGNGAASRYYPNRTPEVEMLSGVCAGGSVAGKECSADSADADCNPNNYAEDGSLIPGATNTGFCQFLTSRESMYGWDGYCIERDSSIQLFGSANEDSRACLTWLPVDQLLGSRDAYANDTEAGYPLEDSYYCGALDLYVDLNVSNRDEIDPLDEAGSSIACAETNNGIAGCTEENNHSCESFVFCPDSYFAILGGCDYNSSHTAAYMSNCVEGTFEDNDCPYICVPNNSIHGDGSRCDLADTSSRRSPDVISSFGTSVYKFVGTGGSDFGTAVEEYLDCSKIGVDASTLSFQDITYPSDWYRNLDIKEDPYLACVDLVQVSSSTEGNKAWTNRLWLSGQYSLGDTTQFANLFTSYRVGTLPERFGQAMSSTSIEGIFGARPLPIQQCLSSGNYLVANPDSFDLVDIPSSIDLCSSEVVEIGPLDSRISLRSTENVDLPRAYNFAESKAVPWIYEGGEVPPRAVYEDYNITSESDEEIVTRLSQLFATSFGLAATFQDNQYGNGDSDQYSWNISDSGDNNGTGANANRNPAGPTIASLGLCYGSQCVEGSEGKFDVNGFDSDNLAGSGGSYHASVKFFAWADSNQMPIRDVTVDWGDGRDDNGTYADYAWPLNSQSGTREDTTSYYKNRRGLISQNVENCSQNDEFGKTSDGCTSAYFNYEHDYYCSRALAGDGATYDGTLPECVYADDGSGRLITSPCKHNNQCVFQPRVHVKDNWGWCTGYCPGGVDGSNGCYDGSDLDGGFNECNSAACPSDDESGGYASNHCVDYSTHEITNPWINYDGVIVLDWQD